MITHEKIVQALKKAYYNPYPNENDPPLFDRQATAILKLIEDEMNDGWLSPVESERMWQEKMIKKIFPHYPDEYFRWQYFNGLISLALEGNKEMPWDEEIEYKSIYTDKSVEDVAQAESKNGWELLQIVGHPNDNYLRLYFKRRSRMRGE